jgi:hypothetical protein
MAEPEDARSDEDDEQGGADGDEQTLVDPDGDGNVEPYEVQPPG